MIPYVPLYKLWSNVALDRLLLVPFTYILPHLAASLVITQTATKKLLMTDTGNLELSLIDEDNWIPRRLPTLIHLIPEYIDEDNWIGLPTLTNSILSPKEAFALLKTLLHNYFVTIGYGDAWMTSWLWAQTPDRGRSPQSRICYTAVGKWSKRRGDEETRLFTYFVVLPLSVGWLKLVSLIYVRYLRLTTRGQAIRRPSWSCRRWRHGPRLLQWWKLRLHWCWCTAHTTPSAT